MGEKSEKRRLAEVVKEGEENELWEALLDFLFLLTPCLFVVSAVCFFVCLGFSVCAFILFFGWLMFTKLLHLDPYQKFKLSFNRCTQNILAHNCIN